MTSKRRRASRERPGKSPAGEVLFCPFCRDSFEGRETCPDHDIPLVSFEALPQRTGSRAIPRDDEVLAPYDPRFGRGIVAAGAVLTFAGFFAPLVSRRGDLDVTYSAFAIASTIAPNLWTVVFAGAMVIAALARRRTLASMRGARLAVLLVGL